MASNVLFKFYGCTTRKEVVQKVYDTVYAGDPNWEIVHEEGGYSSSSPADQDYIVIGAKTAHPGTAYKMQILLCARDNATGTATFGGSAGTKWTILDDSFAIVVSRDGGWNATSKDFADNPSSLPEKQVDFAGSSSATPGYSVSCGTSEDEFTLTGQEAGTVFSLTVGMLVKFVAGGTQRRIAAFFGAMILNGSGTNSWSNTSSPCGWAPNADDDGWVNAVTDVSGLRIDTYATDGETGEYIERYLEVFRLTVGGTYGRFRSLYRVSSALVTRDTFNSQTRIVSNGVSFPWSP